MLALILAAALSQPPARLEIEPWTGKNLATTTGAAVKYRLGVTGKPNSTIRLHAGGVAKGWLAAFCTPLVCAPMRVDVTLPQSGRAVYQFELIREEDSGPKQSGARITGDDGSAVTVPPAVPR
ncbi:MAG: hypothetical protein ABI231_06255 [Candidatus Tumulicola sp.]